MLIRASLRSLSVLRLTLAITLLSSAVSFGQVDNGIFTNRAVGGVAISPEGTLSLPAQEDKRLFRDELAKMVRKANGDLSATTELRMISLRGLEAAIAEAQADGKGDLPDEVKYLAGIQRIQYVLLYPERNDIVLAGPGEGWKVDDGGNIVGVTTGLPVIRLDDLIVAFRTVENARKGGILCSIDPSAEGLQQFEQVVKQAGGQMQPGVVQALEQAMGDQSIRVEGVPETSHFARVLVASDYRMKRYAMELDQAPVKGLPSFLGLLKSKKAALDNMLPRWWLACNYEPLAKSEDGLAFELKGPGVKVMTESDVVEGGKTKASGKQNSAAKQWADAFTAKYAQLMVKDPVFGELRNLMDLCVITALIHQTDLLGQMNLQLPNLTSDKGVAIAEFNAAKKVSSKCSVTKSGRDYIITASGGVDISSWQVIENTKVDPAVSEIRTKAAAKEPKSWYWN